MTSAWSSDIARFWREYVPPCRPSRFDLDVCSNVANIIREDKKRRPDILILGSTVEFRDWAFEEALRVTIVDSSPSFHSEISRDRRYKYSEEFFMECRWEELNVLAGYDLIVGDLVVGNVEPRDTDLFVRNLECALRPGGAFVTKSFFSSGREDIDLDQIFIEYEEKWSYLDPFPLLAYPLTLACMNHKTKMLKFRDMFASVEQAHARGLISENTFKRYSRFGWDGPGKIEFYVMLFSEWEDLLARHFSRFEKCLGRLCWQKDFPVYVAWKGDGKKYERC